MSEQTKCKISTFQSSTIVRNKQKNIDSPSKVVSFHVFCVKTVNDFQCLTFCSSVALTLKKYIFCAFTTVNNYDENKTLIQMHELKCLSQFSYLET